MRRYLAFGPIKLFFMFAMTGLVTGILTGASTSSVVGSLLMVVAGLVGAIGAAALERFARNQEIRRRLADAIAAVRNGLPGELQPALEAANEQRILAVLDTDDTARLLPGLWVLGMIVFLFALLGGVWIGSGIRHPHYPPFDELLTQSEIDPAPIPDAVKGHMFAVYIRTKAARLQPPDQVQLFKQTVRPIVVGKDWKLSTTAPNAKNDLKAIEEAFPPTLTMPTADTNFLMGRD